MATFAKRTFDSARYALFRPTYPRQLFELVFTYHEQTRGARWNLAVDLGCGTGQATVELTPYERVIGIDPSQNMIEQANLASRQNDIGQIEFTKGSAENLPMLSDSSVDLIVAAQSSHWFDWNKVWPEIARVLRPGGTTSIWGYGEVTIPKYSYLQPLISDYYGGPDQLGPYWEEPGSSVIEGLLRDVPAATDICPGEFTEFHRTYFSSPGITGVPASLPTILKKTMTWYDLLQFFRTCSGLPDFHEKHPEDMTRPDGDRIQVEWPLVLLQARKRH